MVTGIWVTSNSRPIRHSISSIETAMTTRLTRSPSTPDGTAAEHLGEGIHITGESGEQLAHLHGVVKPQRQRQRVLEQIVSDAGGETLPNRLDVEGLQPQQPQTQQHSAEQQPDDDPHRPPGWSDPRATAGSLRREAH